MDKPDKYNVRVKIKPCSDPTDGIWLAIQGEEFDVVEIVAGGAIISGGGQERWIPDGTFSIVDP